MNTTATIETRREIVAVLNSINKRINSEIVDRNDACEKARMTTFLSLRSYYMRKLLTMSKDRTTRVA